MLFWSIGDSSGFGGEAKKDSRPPFKTFATLAIPNITMQPALDEVQQAINKAAQMVVSVSKGICQWNKDRKRTGRERQSSGDREGTERRMSIGSVAASEGSHSGMKKSMEPEREMTNYTITMATKNYYKNVSENKEVAKLVGLLSTSINSTKKVNLMSAVSQEKHFLGA